MSIPQLANLKIEKIILHHVFQRDDERSVVPPKLSSDYTNLNAEGLNTLQERITESLGSDSYCIELSIKDDNDTNTFDICNQMVEIPSSKMPTVALVETKKQ